MKPLKSWLPRLSQSMKRLHDESGQVMVLTVLSMAVLLGFVAFAVDVGILLRAKRVMQTAADSGAIAGAAEIKFKINNVTAAARADAAQNGVTDGTNGATVTVNGPPTGPLSGPHAGFANYVEVIVAQSQPTFFMKMFNQNSMTVSARAVATIVPNPTCIYTLSSTPGGGASGISLSNGASLTAPACGITDDASGGNAVSVVAGTSITAKRVGVVGGASSTGTITPTPITGITPVSDPLSSLSPPTVPSSCLPDPSIGGNSAQTLGPSSPGGTACYNGLTIAGAGTITLSPGLYIINGAMSINSSGTISGTGVTFYFPPGASSFSDAGGETLNLSAPSGGAYDGILFYQHPNDTQTMVFSASNGSIQGIFYLPAAQLSMANGGGTTFNISLVVGSLSFTGNTVYAFTPYVSLALAPPLPTPILVE